MNDLFICNGGSVKALGDGRVTGPLALFTSADDPDLDRDYFTKSTDFFLDDEPKAVVIYDHGLDPTLKNRKLTRGKLRIDDVGLWVDAQLQLRDEYEKAIYDLAAAGKLGWSSGSAPHLVERTPIKTAFEIKSWPIVEASLTPIPMEPRSFVYTLKSYIDERDTAVKSLLDVPVARHQFESLLDGAAPAATFLEECEAALAAGLGVSHRAKSIQELRIKSGRVLSDKNRQRIASLQAQLTDVNSALQSLLDDSMPMASDEEKRAVMSQVLRLRARTRQLGAATNG